MREWKRDSLSLASKWCWVHGLFSFLCHLALLSLFLFLCVSFLPIHLPFGSPTFTLSAVHTWSFIYFSLHHVFFLSSQPCVQNFMAIKLSLIYFNLSQSSKFASLSQTILFHLRASISVYSRASSLHCLYCYVKYLLFFAIQTWCSPKYKHF